MTNERRFSLLTDPLIHVRDADGNHRGATLPQVLAALAADEVIAFEALQPHQRQAWYCFLVQLGAIALARTDAEQMPSYPEGWRRLLLSLTKGKEAPWCLVVEDVSRPAFMQPPVPEGSLKEAGYRNDVASPDELDMLVTGRNHDVKMRRVADPRPENWLYSLLTLQTMEGYSGAGNYGIVRMHGGYGSRPQVGLAPGLSWGERFLRDVALLDAARAHIARRYGYSTDGPALLWTLPWHGARDSSIPFTDCDPLFIEICRRVRLCLGKDGIHCWRATTKASRVEAPDELKGVTGDPWTPIDKAETKALNVGADGFTYARLQAILLRGDYEAPPTMHPSAAEDNGGYLVATALARGQGQTEGFHHRVVPVPARAMRIFRTDSERERLGQVAEERVQTAARVASNVLRPALRALVGAGVGRNVDSEKLRPWLRAFDADVDDIFFENLWAALDLPEQEARRRWQERLRDFARRHLEGAIGSVPLPSIHRYRAISAAESTFELCARRVLDELSIAQEQEEDRERLPSC